MCTAGCPAPGTHSSWGACLRAKSTAVMGLESTGSHISRNREIDFNRENDRFAQAVKDGLNPEACTNAAVDAAYKAADAASN